MASVLQLAWLWRKASRMAAGFNPMNSEPLTLLLKLVARHTQAFAHGPELPCLVQIHKLIGWLVASMLTSVAGHPVIIQKRLQCIEGI
jgi:hypothetical protein